jgi:hypothetical protein
MKLALFEAKMNNAMQYVIQYATASMMMGFSFFAAERSGEGTRINDRVRTSVSRTFWYKATQF